MSANFTYEVECQLDQQSPLRGLFGITVLVGLVYSMLKLA